VTGGPAITLKPEEVPQDGKYHVFKIGRIRVKKGTAVWAHASRRMGVRVDRLFVPEAEDPSVNDWDAYISLKAKGPDYVKGSTDSNGLWMDRVILARPPKDEKGRPFPAVFPPQSDHARRVATVAEISSQCLRLSAELARWKR